MGNKAAIALFAVSGVLILFSVYASLLPAVLESRTSIQVNAPKDKIINYLGKASRWEEWLFSDQTKAKEWRVMTTGKDSAVGSVLKWFSKTEGDGALEIKRMHPSELMFERITDNNAFQDRGYLKFTSTSYGTKIEFLDSLDISTNFIARYNAQDSLYSSKIDMENQRALIRLKYKLEAN